METVSILWSSAAAVLSSVPSRIGNDLQNGRVHWPVSDEGPTYDSWIIDDPHRAWSTQPLSMFLRVKGYDAAPYCPQLSSKKIHTVFEHWVSFISPARSPFAEAIVVANSLTVDETLLPVATGITSPSKEKLYNQKAIVAYFHHFANLHPSWSLIPALIPYKLDSSCPRSALQVSPLSTFEDIKLLDVLFDMATLSSNTELDPHIKNDSQRPDLIRDQLRTLPFTSTFNGSGRIFSSVIPGSKERVEDFLEPNPYTVFPNTDVSSIVELQLSVDDRSILPLNGNQYNLTDYLVPNAGILQASSYPPPEYYGGGGSDPPDRPSGGRKGKGRESSWQDDDREYRESSAGGSAGGNNEESGPSKRKTSRKTPMACHFCRKRKLKCDGVQPTCHTCAEKSLICSYDEQIRRRGPGRKNRLTQQQSSSELRQQSEATSQPPSSLPSSSRMAGSLNTPLAALPRPPMPQYPYELGVPPSGLESRIVSSRLASEARYQHPETYVEDYPSRHDVYTQQQPRPSGSAYYPPPPPSTSYPGYQQSSYRDQPQPPGPPPLPPPLPYAQQIYHPAQQYHRQDYPSTSSSYAAEYSSRRQSYAEEEEEYASDDDNTTSSRREPSPGYEGDTMRRGGDTARQR